MQIVKAVLATLGCLGAIVLIALYSGGVWVANNQDKIVETVQKGAGIDRILSKQCAALEARFQSEWDGAVNSHTVDQREDNFADMRRQIDATCAKP